MAGVIILVLRVGDRIAQLSAAAPSTCGTAAIHLQRSTSPRREGITSVAIVFSNRPGPC